MFQYYLLIRYMRPDLFPTLAADYYCNTDPPRIIVRQVGLAYYVYFLQEQIALYANATQESFNFMMTYFDPKITQFWFEPGTTTYVPVSIDDVAFPVLATVSPDLKRYKEFAKAAKKAYMPLFTLSELLRIGDDIRNRPNTPQAIKNLLTSETIEERFNEFNGIFRYIFLHGDELEEVRDKRNDALDALINGELGKLFAFPTIESNPDEQRRHISHLILKYDVTYDENSTKPVDNFSKVRFSFVSAEIKDKIIERLQFFKLEELMQKLKADMNGKSSVTDALGKTYEMVCTRLMVIPQGVLWMMKKSGSADSSEVHEAPVFFVSIPLTPPTILRHTMISRKESCIILAKANFRSLMPLSRETTNSSSSSSNLDCLRNLIALRIVLSRQVNWRSFWNISGSILPLFRLV